jgi:hypothetical protein
VPAHGSLEIRPPASELFHQPADADDLVVLIRDIKFLSTGFLTAKLAVLVKKLQPEAVMIGDDISFNIGIMADGTRRAVRIHCSWTPRPGRSTHSSAHLESKQRVFGSKTEDYIGEKPRLNVRRRSNDRVVMSLTAKERFARGMM